MQTLTVSDKEAGLRADVFIAARKSQFSRSSLRPLFNRGLIQINGQAIKSSHRLKTGQKIEVDSSILSKKPPLIKLPIIYEDDDVIVINKPAGILTHSKGALNNNEATVASWLLEHLKKDYDNTKPPFTRSLLVNNRFGIVHRLDRHTSGVMICAKNQRALKWLQEQFSTRKVQKNYVGIVEGQPKEPAAIIDAPIARNPRKPQSFWVSPLGRPATTTYKTIKTLRKGDKTCSLLEFVPQTGRTHQIRVHSAFIGHPVVGDSVYGNPDDYMFLHAKSLQVKLPNGESKKFTAKPPIRFEEF